MNMLHHVDRRNQGVLDWASYLHAMTLIRPYDYESKVDSLISTVVKPRSPSSSFVQRLVRREGLRKFQEQQMMAEKSIDFQDFRMMCLQGIQ